MISVISELGKSLILLSPWPEKGFIYLFVLSFSPSPSFSLSPPPRAVTSCPAVQRNFPDARTGTTVKCTPDCMSDSLSLSLSLSLYHFPCSVQTEEVVSFSWDKRIGGLVVMDGWLSKGKQKGEQEDRSGQCGCMRPQRSFVLAFPAFTGNSKSDLLTRASSLCISSCVHCNSIPPD